jgi:hypothetical protein
VAVAHRQIAATRNAGARAAHGDLLIFVEADTIVAPEIVRAAVEAMRAGAVGGGCAVRFDGHVPRHARLMLAALLPLYRRFRLASGSFLFCVRGAFEAAGGFDESLFAAEEAAMSRALHRQGRFVFLDGFVTTSGRRFGPTRRASYTASWRGSCCPAAAVKRRDGLDLWYGERRKDPEGLT